MPIFEYTCEDCGTGFEKLVRRAGQEPVACPSCGHDHVKRELSRFAAHGASAESAAPAVGGCPAGMCQTPGLCGRDN
jgi:putative FmdB family regulatory protein